MDSSLCGGSGITAVYELNTVNRQMTQKRINPAAHTAICLNALLAVIVAPEFLICSSHLSFSSALLRLRKTPLTIHTLRSQKAPSSGHFFPSGTSIALHRKDCRNGLYAHFPISWESIHHTLPLPCVCWLVSEIDPLTEPPLIVQCTSRRWFQLHFPSD